MIHEIKKRPKGHTRVKTKKDVHLSLNKNGYSKSGKIRYAATIRFRGDSYKKATESDYITLEYDDDLNRLYFLTATEDEGFKLTQSNGKSESKYFSFLADEDIWRPFTGEYYLLRDVEKNKYYIDLVISKED